MSAPSALGASARLLEYAEPVPAGIIDLQSVAETTVGAMLEAYPELESVFVEMAPRSQSYAIRWFAGPWPRLQPLSRRGSAELASGDDSAAPQCDGASAPDTSSAAATDVVGDDASWLTSDRVVEEIDADAMPGAGVHPIGKIREAGGSTWSGRWWCCAVHSAPNR